MFGLFQVQCHGQCGSSVLYSYYSFMLLITRLICRVSFLIHYRWPTLAPENSSPVCIVTPTHRRRHPVSSLEWRQLWPMCRQVHMHSAAGHMMKRPRDIANAISSLPKVSGDYLARESESCGTPNNTNSSTNIVQTLAIRLIAGIATVNCRLTCTQ